jgi:tRNA(Arg) A34 adenosine deaminase TadA
MDPERRRLVTGLAAGAIAPAWGARPARAQGTERESFMRRALELRRQAVERGDQPYGGVVVKDGRIVGEAGSAVVVRRDPTAHADIEAVRDAARRLGNADLSGCEIYLTSRPCPMCETACYWARIARIYVGEGLVDAGPPRYPSC